MAETIRQTFYVRALDKKVKECVKSCEICQESKITAARPVGKVPLRTVRSTTPFEIVRIDLCGPWTVDVECTKPPKTLKRSVHAVTITDDATSWPEIEYIEEKSAKYIARKFDGSWLCRYPRPKTVIYDNGGEFTGAEFQELLASYGIKRQPTTVMNPQSNGVKERMHLTMADMLRSMTFEVDDESERAWRNEAQIALQAVTWALRSTVNASTKVSPANMVFKRNMVLNQAVKVNWEAIKKYQDNKARVDNVRENKTRKEFEYKINNFCYIVKNKFERKSKLQRWRKDLSR